jgi:mRNA-degrading endonuclease YafQ of YafQ-DinJ toxin-antitoxin module
MKRGIIIMSKMIQQVQKRMLISLAQIAKEINIKEGDHILIEERDGGIFLKPVGWHDKSQEYFWRDKWQEKMNESEKALQAGKYTTHNNVDDLLKELEELETDADNPKHPSLQIHKIKGTIFWEAYVNKDIRIVYEQTSDTLTLMAIVIMIY